MSDSEHDIKKHISVYRNVFIALLFFTVLTVLVSYVEFDATERYIAGAVFIGLIIASAKGYLVAAHFMHLNNEKPMINWSLILTVIFFIVLLFMPLLWDMNNMGKDIDYWGGEDQQMEMYHDVN
jgi:caa(3)-type oxidase subunit IV